MINETYSAGLISQSFWFIEMKKIIKLIADGKTEEEIKKLEQQKQKAVEEEDFIVAESLKNQIEKLRGRV